MFERPAVVIAIVTGFLVGTIASDGSLHTIRKDYPSGAAAKVSHNRAVRMFEKPNVAIAAVMAFFVGAIASDGDPDTIRKACPSGAAAMVSHNRLVRMSELSRPP